MRLLTFLKRRLLPRKPPPGAPKDFGDAVTWLTYILRVPTRYLSDDELEEMARFYGDSPCHCVFIALSVLYQVAAKWPHLDGDRTTELANAVLQHLFGDAGAEVLLYCSNQALAKQQPTALEGRRRAEKCVLFLAKSDQIRAIPEFQLALECGRKLAASIDPVLRGKPDEFVALVGLHNLWLYSHFEQEFEKWLIAQKALERLGSIVRRLDNAS